MLLKWVIWKSANSFWKMYLIKIQQMITMRLTVDMAQEHGRIDVPQLFKEYGI